MKRVLITGPSTHITEWSEAARSVRWTAIEFPLLAVFDKNTAPVDVLGSTPEIDWICVTSSNALPFIKRALAEFPNLAVIPAAAVGDRTTNELARLGCSIALEPSTDAHELAERVSSRASRSARVLWPHGDRSDEFAHILRGRRLTVVDPIVYESRSRDDLEIPASDVVFFASPSAVGAWHERAATGDGPRLAIAIGGTTLSALHAETEARFERLMVLPAPTPEAFADALAHVDI
ncbi:MAG: uroporphyrinogen-III synthase [Planctomycetes bacterium]|nr:uroporphyrinogen-III synthase [Planctomycetota bacterium]